MLSEMNLMVKVIHCLEKNNESRTLCVTIRKIQAQLFGHIIIKRIYVM